MAESLRDLVVSLSLNTENFTRNIKSVNKQIREAESYFKLAGAGIAGFEQSAAGSSAQMSMLQRKLSLQQQIVKQYEGALNQANAKLSECATRQADYTHRLAEARSRQSTLRAEVQRVTERYERYKNILGETDAQTVQAKNQLDALQQALAACDGEVEKLSGQQDALRRQTQNAADAVSTQQTQLNNATAAMRETEREIQRLSSQWTQLGVTMLAASEYFKKVSFPLYSEDQQRDQACGDETDADAHQYVQ